MKKFLGFSLVFILMISIISLIGQDFNYVGASKCKICHRSESRGSQYQIWEKSKHSQSFEAFQTDKAQEYAQQAGVENPSESEKCLQCHSPLFNEAPEFKEEGVNCESCHGPGSEYKSLSVMKNQEEAVKKGLKVYESTEEIKSVCLSCHEDAHNQDFDFESSWEKIKHPVPEKNNNTE